MLLRPCLWFYIANFEFNFQSSKSVFTLIHTEYFFIKKFCNNAKTIQLFLYFGSITYRDLKSTFNQIYWALLSQKSFASYFVYFITFDQSQLISEVPFTESELNFDPITLSQLRASPWNVKHRVLYMFTSIIIQHMKRNSKSCILL